MGNKSDAFGRAYEYACVTSIYSSIERKTGAVEIIKDSSYEHTKRAWLGLPSNVRKTLKLGADAIVDTLFDLEPMILDSAGGRITLRIQPDDRGVGGDVRDLLIIRSSKNWEIGLSLKHNHFAVKHSRLSKTADFGLNWYGVGCSEEYWADVKPVFDLLERYKSKKTKWKDVDGKASLVYLPILRAFKREIEKAGNTPGVPSKLVEYLLGKFDFYKVVSIDRKLETQLYSYNLHGTLNRRSGLKKPNITVPRVDLPTRIVAVEMKPNSDNTVELYLDNGWQFAFRIHNASANVETSLKFDIQLKGMPTSVTIFVCKWSSAKSG